jgi:hypothetical protein
MWVGIAAKLTTRTFHRVQVFTGWGGAAACNVFVVACHGRSKLTERYFIRQLSECRELRGKPLLGKQRSHYGHELPLETMICVFNTRLALHELLELGDILTAWSHVQHLYAGISDLDGGGLGFITDFWTSW